MNIKAATAIMALLLAPPAVVPFTPVTTEPKTRRAARGDGSDAAVARPAPAPPTVGRRDALAAAAAAAAALLRAGPARAAEGKSYSANARNMARLNDGDASGGSTYDNDPPSPRARTRRAMVGCKNAAARARAAEGVGARKLSEKECNTRVMSGDADFMLKALVELDCPVCPYGIGSR